MISSISDGNRLLDRARALDASGEPEAALDILRQAAATGAAEAMAELGLWYVIGHGGKPAPVEGAHLVFQAAGSGHILAKLLAATLTAGGIGTPRDWSAAGRWLIEAACARDPRACLQLGLLLPKSNEWRPMIQGLLAHAALADLSAAHIALAVQYLDHDTADMNQLGLGLLVQALRLGNPVARDLLEKYRGQGWRPADLHSLDTVSDTLPVLERLDPDLLQWPHEQPLPPFKTLSDNPRAISMPKLLTPVLCAHAAALGRPFLAPATVHDAEAGEIQDPTRTNAFANFYPLEADAVLQSIDWRLMQAGNSVSERPTCETGDVLSMLYYQPGQRYRPHFDFFDPEFPAHRPHLQQNGQRRVTVLVSLNTGYTGGDTHFPHAKADIDSNEKTMQGNRGLSWRGAVGGSLIFVNVDENDRPDKASLHEGLSPSQGEKWILSKWLRAGKS